MSLKFKKGKGLLAMLLLCGVLASGNVAKADKFVPAKPESTATTEGTTTEITTTETTTETEGIVQGWNSNKTSYYEKGKKVTGIKNIDGNLYYFNKSGKLYTKKGLRKLGNNTYYFTKSHTMMTGVVKVKSKYYYFQKKNGARYEVAGVSKVDGKYYRLDDSFNLKSGWYRNSKNKRYYFNKKTFQALTGWNYVGKYKYYFSKKGQLSQDVRKKLSKKQKKSYSIIVNRKSCVVTVYAKDGNKGYTIPVVAFVCSPGKDTPTGTFKTGIKHRWHELFGPCWGQWTTQITGNILFHSVYYDEKNDNKTLNVKAYNKLGTMASHGCIRLRAGDAKWIYDNCKTGTKVKITNSKKYPFDKPVSQKLSSSHTWDPTDPTID